MIELLDNSAVIRNTQEMFELLQDLFVFARVKLSLMTALQLLNLEEKIIKHLYVRDIVDVNGQNGFNRFETLRVLTHCSVMDWVSLHFVLST
jgi:hypothetical protein